MNSAPGTYEVAKTSQGWMLTIGDFVAPMFFDTRKAAVAYAKRKLNGHDPDWHRVVRS